MSGFVLFMLFIGLMLVGVPIGAALGLGGIVAIAMANADSQWWGLLAAPQNMQAGIAKYPLLALPMFVLVGSIFDRSGVAQRLVDFAVACVGRSAGMLPMVAVLVAMILGEGLVHHAQRIRECGQRRLHLQRHRGGGHHGDPRTGFHAHTQSRVGRIHGNNELHHQCR
jgi:hypothetical protein